MSQPTARYTGIAIALHWAIALVIVLQVFGGMALETFAAGDIELAKLAYNMHKTFGLLVLFLSLARLAWRLLNPPPPEPVMPGWQVMVSRVTHWMFYGLMIGVPLSGWLMVSVATPDLPTLLFNVPGLAWPHLPGLAAPGSALADVLHEAHEVLAFATMGLLGLHVGAALKHQFVDKDNLLARMVPGVFGPTQAQAPSRRSGVIAVGVFGVPLLLGLVVSGFSGLDVSSTSGSGNESGARDGGTVLSQAGPVGEDAWLVDSEASDLRFTVNYSGRELVGTIPDWTAAIRFDASALDAGAARVVVDAASIATGDGYFDGRMASNDGLYVSEHPQIVVNLSRFRAFSAEDARLDGGLEEAGPDEAGDWAYVADADIVLAGKTFVLPFLFDVAIDGDVALMTGALRMDRFAVDLGVINDPSGMYLGDEIVVTAQVRATRAD